ncbi:MAG: 50S ribosomal protein L6 [Patescibacteria group bacterium]
MSRIGKKPIQIPQGVEAKIEYPAPRSQKIIIKGQKGELFLNIPPEVRVESKEGKLFVFLQIESKKAKAMWGLIRSLVFNMVLGVCQGYEKKLEIEGVGYGAQVKGEELELKVGYINTLKIKAPPGIKFSVEKNVISVSGIDKELVGQIAAKVRKAKPAEPYKGKGIKYLGEVIRRKVGKRVESTTSSAA